MFTINTKHHRGQHVWVAAKRILVGGQRTDHLRNARYEARRTSKLLSVAARTLVDVTPIIAIAGAKGMTVRERPHDVVVLREHELMRWLQRHPVTFLSRCGTSRPSPCSPRPGSGCRRPSPRTTPRSTGCMPRSSGRAGRRHAWTAAIVVGVMAAIPVAVVTLWSSIMAALLNIANGSPPNPQRNPPGAHALTSSRGSPANGRRRSTQRQQPVKLRSIMTDAPTRFTQLLGIRHPIVLGPFGGLSSVELTATVSKLGGLGSYGL